MKSLFKSTGFLFTVLFAIAAALQYNDPDALVWIAIWGLASVISLAFALNKVSWFVTLVMGILCFVGFFYLFPPKLEGFEIGAGDIVNIELAREAFGVLIIAVIMFFYTIAIRYSRRS
ncbi:hypothetical protein MNBD_BACTEROID03-2488 [hydrothermal vent metagenome]|uniref:Transmembrane family 220, helix n=1 Tax=hydrothermal vent metagenome TaxID=652676 RepID=A0A3B0TTL9_9ZZZZ